MRSRYISVNNTKIHYFEYGSRKKPLLLFIHGMHGSAITIASVCELLAESFNVIAPDLPGYAKSDELTPHFDIYKAADLFNRMMDSILKKRKSKRKYFIGGISLGATIVMEMILLKRDNKIGAGFLEPFCSMDCVNLSPVKIKYMKILIEFTKLFSKLSKKHFSDLFYNDRLLTFILNTFKRSKLDAADLQYSLDCIHICKPDTYIYTLDSILKYRRDSTLQSDIKSLVILSRKDKTLDHDKTMSAFVKVFPNYKLDFIDYEGHNPPIKPTKHEINNNFPGIIKKIDDFFLN